MGTDGLPPGFCGKIQTFASTRWMPVPPCSKAFCATRGVAQIESLSIRPMPEAGHRPRKTAPMTSSRPISSSIALRKPRSKRWRKGCANMSHRTQSGLCLNSQFQRTALLGSSLSPLSPFFTYASAFSQACRSGNCQTTGDLSIRQDSAAPESGAGSREFLSPKFGQLLSESVRRVGPEAADLLNVTNLLISMIRECKTEPG